MIEIREEAGFCLLALYVQPGAKKKAILGEHAGRLKIAVTQPPEKGLANEGVIELLAASWNLSKGQLEVIRGHTHRQKTISISGVTKEQVQSFLNQIPGRSHH